MTSQVLTTQSFPSVDAFARLLRAHAALTRELSARLLADHGLSITDYQCLLALAHADDGEMRRVKGTCATDARVTYAVLTDEGRERLESAGRSHVAQVRELFEQQLSSEELETLVELLGRLPGGAGGRGEACSVG